MQIKPLKDRVLVAPEKKQEKTSSGIYLPDANEKMRTGKVVAVGDDEKEIRVKPGDTVLYESFSGNELEYDGEKYVLLHAADVLAKLG